MSNHRSAPIPLAPDDIQLAWALADAARPYLSAPEQNAIHISIGVGETFSAIDVLVTAVARERLPGLGISAHQPHSAHHRRPPRLPVRG